MIKIRPIRPSDGYYLIDWSGFYLGSIYCGNFQILLYDYIVDDVVEQDVGCISTSKAALDGQNNCFHHDVSGSLDAEAVDWYTATLRKDGSSYDVRITSNSKLFEETNAVLRIGGTFKSAATKRKSSSYWKYDNDWGTRVEQLCNIQFTHYPSADHTYDGFVNITATQIISYKPGDSGCIQRPTEVSEVVTTVWLNRCQRIAVSGLVAQPYRYIDISWIFSLQQSDQTYDSMIWRSDRLCSFGDLSAKAAESVRLCDINGIAYLKDFTELGKLASSLVRGFGHSIKGVIKGLSGAYLAAHYGLKLTVKDTEELASAIDRIDLEHEFQTVGAQQHIDFEHPNGTSRVSCDIRCTARVKALSNNQIDYFNFAKDTMRKLYEFDLAPTAANLWDMIPFSFVVDWFAPIGDAAEKLEVRNYVQSFDVHQAFYSRKMKWTTTHSFEWGGYLYSGDAVHTLYERYCSPSMILPPLRVDQPSEGLSGHWVESAALILSSVD